MYICTTNSLLFCLKWWQNTPVSLTEKRCSVGQRSSFISVWVSTCYVSLQSEDPLAFRCFPKGFEQILRILRLLLQEWNNSMATPVGIICFEETAAENAVSPASFDKTEHQLFKIAPLKAFITLWCSFNYCLLYLKPFGRIHFVRKLML